MKLGFVGGSCTEGAGIPNLKRYLGWAPRLVRSLQSIFNSTRTEHIRFYNGASGGVASSYLSACVHDHVHNDSDLVFVELSVNDHSREMDVAIPFEKRAPFEILIRRLLQLPHRPAVVVFNGLRWSHQTEANREGEYTNNAEADFSDFISYYELPSISIKASVYHLMQMGVPNFIPTGGDERGDTRNDTWFGGDGVHPNFYNGHRAYSELAMYLLLKTARGLKRRPLADLDMKYVNEPLPPPVIPNNYETPTPSCFFSTQFKQLVSEAVDFPYVNDDPEQRWVKWGYSAKKPGAKLTLKLDIRSALREEDIAKSVKEAAASTNFTEPSIKVAVLYVKSWRGFGKASYECQGGCSCDSKVVDGQVKDRVSLVFVHQTDVRLKLERDGPSNVDCLMTWTVLEESSSPAVGAFGRHSFKICGAILSVTEVDESDFNHAGLLVKHSKEFLDNNFWTSTTNESIVPKIVG